ncbi:GNAT family N-acetyltransferase [Sphingomonas sp.]
MIETGRLTLRWPDESDVGALAAMFADEQAMALFGPVRDAKGTRAILDRHAGYRGEGLGFWATVERASGKCVGFCGLKPGANHTPIAGGIEIGWLIARGHWGRGFAREAAGASLAAAWQRPGVDRVVAIVSRVNAASHKVARALGMGRETELDFMHPAFDRHDPLAAMWTYAIGCPG